MLAKESSETLDEFRVDFVQAGVWPVFDQEPEPVRVGLRGPDREAIAGLSLAVRAILEVVLDGGTDPFPLTLTV